MDPVDSQFEEDLKKAMALSLESHALEQFRQSSPRTRGQTLPPEPLRRHSHQVAPSLSRNVIELPKRNNSVIETKPRPRPTGSSSSRARPVMATQPQSLTLLPKPPEAKSAKDISTVDHFGGSTDLMSFNPAPKAKDDFLEALDALYEQQPPSRPFSTMPRSISGSFSTEPFNQFQLPSRPFQPPQRNQSAFSSPQHRSQAVANGNGFSQQGPSDPSRMMMKSTSWTGNLNKLQVPNSSCSSVKSSGALVSMSATTSPINQPVISSIGMKKSSVSDYSLASIMHRKDNDSLIDLGAPLPSQLTKVSVLEAFDPLLMNDDDDEDFKIGAEDAPDAEEEELYHTSTLSDSSVYEPFYDPFEYMVSKAQRENLEDEAHESLEASSNNEPIYATPSKKKHTRHPSYSGGPDQRTMERRKKQKAEYEKVMISRDSIVHFVTKEESNVASDSEVQAFVDMVTRVRSKYKFDDAKTNAGLVISAKIQSSYPANTSVKLSIGFARCMTKENVVKFTCDVTTTIEHIIGTVLLEIQGSAQIQDYLLQVSGISEFLEVGTQLQDYEYVHQCYKFDTDVEFICLPKSDMVKTLARTAQDDLRDSLVKIEDVAPLDQMRKISYEELRILLETLEKECSRVAKVADQLSACSDKEVMPALRPKQVTQSVKAICKFLGEVETFEISDSCEKFITFCLEFDKAKGNEEPSGRLRPEIVEEVGEKYATVILKSVTNFHVEHASKIKKALNQIQDSVQKLIEIYSRSFRVNFTLNNELSLRTSGFGQPKETIEVKETLLLRVCALHRLPDWDYDEYKVSLQIYHGTRPIADPLQTTFQSKSESFYQFIKFDSWLESKNVQICNLPREARLVLTLYGRETVIEDKQPKLVLHQLGWSALQLFNFERYLAQGTFLLNLWPPEAEKQVGPAPDCGSHPYADTCPLLSIELPELSTPVVFPVKIPIQLPPRHDYNFDDLDYMTQQELLDVCDQDIITFTEMPAQEREVLWEKRYYLSLIPGALPKVLLAAHSWEFACLPGLYGLLKTWKRPAPMDVLQLFLPCFPDTHVREVAIEWLSSVSSDDFVDYLPQLLEALKHETWSASPLAKLILERCLESPRVSHSLYWLLAQSLPGQTPQNTTADNPLDRETKLKVARYRRRLQMMMRALYTISGDAIRKAFLTQQELLQLLNQAAAEVKATKDSNRQFILHKHMESLHLHLTELATPIPLSLGSIASGMDLKSCSYFPSNTMPLKLAFTSNALRDPTLEVLPTIPAIFKVGDDLRQDQLTLQMIRIMDKLWLKEGLDLKMVTFGCVPTGDRQGMVEMVTEAKTLREIQVMGNRGVTGSFKDTPISDYLVKHNPSQLEFARAVNNFTRSCAGYSVVTYILGICDRHNDNIMVKQSGHLFHIDFGKFLGDAQMFGNFKRDRTPFVLTPDMVYVINGGDKPSQKFHDFVDICCKSFNIIRKNGNLLLNLFALMASSGIPGVTMDAVSYVQRALLSDLSPAEAAATFSRMIEESLNSVFTQWNFFFHNLAQKRFTSSDAGGANESDNGELLSFIPKAYSLKSDGRITDVVVYGIQKRYSPEKHYVFILKITRESVKTPTYVFRTYKEFCELDSKLHTAFPLSGCHSLPKGLQFGRQEVHAVAEQRKHEIARFLNSLFGLNISISQSDLVYTFFHPLLRDQQDADIHIRKLRVNKSGSTTSPRKAAVGMIKGELKLTVEYRRDVLHVMVCHGRNLAIPDGSRDEPNSYVKVYLRPDPHKATKRKTRVVRKNCHPSFMEMLEYRMPLDIVRCRTLQATIWDCDRFQENMFLGAVTIPLQDLKPNTEVTNWYPLTNFSRMT